MLIKEKKAIDYLNKEAEQILNLLSPIIKKKEVQRLPKSISHKIIRSFDEKEIKYETKSFMNIEGKEISRYFFIKPELCIGLDFLNYRRFEKFINQLYKRKNIISILSERALKSITFAWLRGRYLRKIDESLSFTQFFESVIPNYVEKFKLSIPISFLEIDDSFEVGRVKFKYFTTDLFDKIEMKLREHINKNKITPEEAKSFIKQLRKEYQGKVVANHLITAEEQKAIEIANEETEKALSILKFFSPSALYPKITANFGRKGIANLPCEYVFIFKNEIPKIYESVLVPTKISFVIDHITLQGMLQSGLDKLSEIIKKENINEFEELLLNAVYTYSKALSYINFHEKLIFILSSAEIIFLKNYTEPIQYTLGQRLGFFVYDDAEKRKNVVDLIKNAYEKRSKFLHHGLSNSDYPLLSELQLTIWNALRKIVNLSDKFKKKVDFIAYVEKIIYS